MWQLTGNAWLVVGGEEDDMMMAQRSLDHMFWNNERVQGELDRSTTVQRKNRSREWQELIANKGPTVHVMIPIIALTYILHGPSSSAVDSQSVDQLHRERIPLQPTVTWQTAATLKRNSTSTTWWVHGNLLSARHWNPRPQFIDWPPTITSQPTSKPSIGQVSPWIWFVEWALENVLAIFVIVRICGVLSSALLRLSFQCSPASSRSFASSSLSCPSPTLELTDKLTHFSIKPNQLSLLRPIRTVTDLPNIRVLVWYIKVTRRRLGVNYFRADRLTSVCSVVRLQSIKRTIQRRRDSR